MAIFWESQRSNIIPINCGGAQMFFFLLFAKFFVCLFLIWSRGVGVVGVLLIAFIWLPKPKLHFSKILPSHNYILKIEYKYLSHKKSFGKKYQHCVLCISSWIAIRSMLFGLKWCQKLFGTCFYIFFQGCLQRLLCEASLCIQLHG